MLEAPKARPGNVYGTGQDRSPEAFIGTPSPMRGNFISVSSPARSRSSSPKRCQQEEDGVYIHLSLTDSQVDTLATALSTQVTPEHRQRNVPEAMDVADSMQRHVNDTKFASTSRSRSRSPVKFDASFHSTSRGRSKSRAKYNGRGRARKFEFESSLASTAEFSSLSPTKKTDRQASPCKPVRHNSSPSLAERRNRSRPPPIDTWLAQRHANPKSHTNGHRPIIVQVPPRPSQPEQAQPSTPPTRRIMEDDSADYESSSFYSYEGGKASSLLYISPLHVRKALESPQHPHVLRDYSNWKNAATPRVLPDASPNGPLSAHPPEQADALPPQIQRGLMHAQPTYSPLTPFFSTKDMPASKTAKKIMIGDNGWLERTTTSPEKKPSPAKKGGFLDNLKKKAKEMVDMGDLKAARRTRDSEKERDTSRNRLAVSVDPREQSLLYCELEFALTNALNNYITCQFNAGLLEADKLKKIADGWQQKGRPKVVGFRYDLETQLELVRLHAAQFRFYSRSITIAALNGNLEMMKVNARAIRIRTFCQPDTVIAKQLLDAQGLFNILGCSEREQIQLAEIVQFFKTVLERERFFQAKRADRDSAVSGRGQGQRQSDHDELYGQQRESHRGGGQQASFDDDLEDE